MSSTTERLAIGVLLSITIGAAEAEAASANEEQAYQLSQRGAALYRAGHFREAAKVLREAHALFPEPTLLYNLGRALDSDGDLEGAIDAFRRYLAVEQRAVDRGAIERRVATLERQVRERDEGARQREVERQQLAQQQQQLARDRSDLEQRASVSAAPVRMSRGRRAAPWALLGVGAAGLVIGAGLGGFALSQDNTAQRASVDAISAQARLDSARSYGLGATISLALGGAVAASGLIWGVVDVVRSRRAGRGGAR